MSLDKYTGLINTTGLLKRAGLLISTGLIKVYETELTTILDVFTQAPQLDGGIYKWMDLSGYNNHLDCANMQSACFPAINPVTASVPSIDFTGVSSVTYKTKFIYKENRRIYPISFNGFSAASNGFQYIIGADNFQVLRMSNGTSNVSYAAGSISTWGLSDGDLVDMEIVFTLSGTTKITVNGSIVYSTTTSIGGSFLIPTSRLVNFNVSGFDAHIIYSELVGYWKHHYKESTGNVIFDTTGNENHLTATTNNINWNSYYGDYPAEFINGFTNNAGLIVLGLDDLSTDVQGNAIQYPVNSGFIDGTSNEVVIPVHLELNTIIPSGDYSWQDIDDLVESDNIIKNKPNATTISRLIVKKNLTGELFSEGILTLTAILGLSKKL